MPAATLSLATDPVPATGRSTGRPAATCPARAARCFSSRTPRRAARSAPAVYGEIAGYAATQDAHHYRSAAPDGRQYARAVELALQRAGARPQEVDLVLADGAGRPDADAAEAAALRSVFGPHGVPVTAPQGLVGRLLAGGSALNVATALLAMRAGVIPPVGNLDDPDPAYGLDLVREPREQPAGDRAGHRPRTGRLQQRPGPARLPRAPGGTPRSKGGAHQPVTTGGPRVRPAAARPTAHDPTRSGHRAPRGPAPAPAPVPAAPNAALRGTPFARRPRGAPGGPHGSVAAGSRGAAGRSPTGRPLIDAAGTLRVRTGAPKPAGTAVRTAPDAVDRADMRGTLLQRLVTRVYRRGANCGQAVLSALQIHR